MSSTLSFYFLRTSYRPAQSRNVGVVVILIMSFNVFVSPISTPTSWLVGPTSTNIDPMNNSLKLTLYNIIDSYFEKDEADFNILSESNIDSLYYGIDDLHKCEIITYVVCVWTYVAYLVNLIN